MVLHMCLLSTRAAQDTGAWPDAFQKNKEIFGSQVGLFQPISGKKRVMICKVLIWASNGVGREAFAVTKLSWNWNVTVRPALCMYAAREKYSKEPYLVLQEKGWHFEKESNVLATVTHLSAVDGEP